MKRRLLIIPVSILAGWAIEIPLRIESWVLTIGLAMLMYAPVIVIALIAVRNRRSPMGAAILLALGCVLCLRLAAAPLMFRLGFRSRVDLWGPVVSCLPAAVIFFFKPAVGVRPATIIAGTALAWWFAHTFTDFIYYRSETVPMSIAVGAAICLIALVSPSARWSMILWSAVEPVCVVLIGYLSSLPFYKIHTLNMRIPDLAMQLFAVTLPCALLGAGWAFAVRR